MATPTEERALLEQAASEGDLRRATDPVQWHESIRRPALGFAGGLGGAIGASKLVERGMPSAHPGLRGLAGLGAGAMGGIGGLGLGAGLATATLPKSRQMKMMQGVHNQIEDPEARLDYLRQVGIPEEEANKEGSFKYACYTLGAQEALNVLFAKAAMAKSVVKKIPRGLKKTKQELAAEKALKKLRAGIESYDKKWHPSK